MTVFMVIRATLFLVWLLSPPFLVILTLLKWKRNRAVERRNGISITLGLVVSVNWILFLAFVLGSQTPYGMDFQTSFFTHSLLVLACFAAVASIFVSPRRWSWFFPNVLLVTLWVVIAYAPGHWLKRWDYGSVQIDGHPTPATVYIGSPTDSEAEAVVLVHIPATADYFLSFGEEKIRLAKEHEYVRLPGGIWSFRSMRDMVFTEPLPSHQLNEFRMASPKGGVVSVQF